MEERESVFGMDLRFVLVFLVLIHVASRFGVAARAIAPSTGGRGGRNASIDLLLQRAELATRDNQSFHERVLQVVVIQRQLPSKGKGREYEQQLCTTAGCTCHIVIGVRDVW